MAYPYHSNNQLAIIMGTQSLNQTSFLLFVLNCKIEERLEKKDAIVKIKKTSLPLGERSIAASVIMAIPKTIRLTIKARLRRSHFRSFVIVV